MPSDPGDSAAMMEPPFVDLHHGTEKHRREAVKRIGDRLKRCSEWTSDTEYTAKYLINHFITLPSKSSLKPYILSFIDGCDSRIVPQVQETFTECLKQKFVLCEVPDRRHVSDSICRLLDTKNMVVIVSDIVSDVLRYLSWCIESARDESARIDRSVEFNDAMMDIKVSVHTLNKCLQKTDAALMADHSNVLESLISISITVIKQENALLDCQTSCAMTLPLVYRILHGENAMISLIHDLFETPKPDFQLYTSSVQTYLCVLTGLVGGMSSVDLVKNYKGSSVLCFSAEKIFDAYDRIEEGTKCKYALSRCLVVLTSKMISCADSGLSDFNVMQKRLLQYVYDHLEDPVDAIRHQAKNVFENVVSIHVKVYGNTEKLIVLAEDILSMDWHRKGKYGLLSVLTSRLDTSIILQICPNLPSLMLGALDEMGMSNYVCELYDKLMLKHRDAVSIETWHETWLDPVVQSLSRPVLRKSVIEYILPKVLQATKSGMKSIIPNLISGKICNDSLLVLVTCLKRARCLGYIPQIDGTDDWNDILPYRLLNCALEHSEANVRVEALGLLCFNPKTTEPVPKSDLNLIQGFVLNNLTCQSPAIRQDIVSALRKLIIRIKESWSVLSKKQSQDHMMYYVNFIADFYTGLLRNLYPGVSYTRRSSVLAILETSVTVLSDVPGFPSLDSVTTVDLAENLLLMLTDTFEENKTRALNLLLRINGSKLGLNSVEKIREIVRISDELVRTTRPQDCGNAAFLHKLLIQQPCLSEALEDERSDNGVEDRQEALLKKLVREFSRQVDIAEKDLIHASVNAPMYPVLHCIRHLLNDVQYKKLANTDTWRKLLDELSIICFKACAVVSPVVSHASPEGNVPVHDLIGGEGDDVSLSTVQDMPEFLVVCSWRTVKEVSLLLGDLSCWPIHGNDSRGFITESTLLKIGQFFTDLLLESRHRGAFELAYAGFQPMCTMLWTSKLESLNQLPQTWVEKIIEDIRNADSEESRLCATRRSAGVPFYVLALVVTEPSSRGRQCLASVMDALLTMAEDCHTVPQIHSLNTLRALYKDNRLGESVLPYISQGMKIAVLGFNAETWGVRNASTLLFSTLMVRIFGVRRDRNIISSKNSLSGRIFFYRYPALFPFLLDRLTQCTDNIETLNPGLYPVLMILGRLTPSILEGTDTAMNVAEFIPFVMRCAASPVLKTREMGARALCPIVFRDQFEAIVSKITQGIAQSSSMNLTHGLLLQLQGLLDDAVCRNMEVSSELLKQIYKTNHLMNRRNPCYLTRSACVEVMHSMLALIKDERFRKRVMDDCLVIVHQETAALSPRTNVGHSQYMTELIRLYLSHCREFDEGRLLTFLTGHRLYEVRELALKFIMLNPDLSPINLCKRLEKETHPTCLALLLDILSSLNQFHEIPREINSKRYDVQCARLRYLPGRGNDNRLNLIRELSESCKPDRVWEVRIATAQAVLKLGDELVKKSPYQAQLWSVCITLLLDDDEEVRSYASDVISRISNNDDEVKISHGVALVRAIDMIFGNVCPSDCISLMTDFVRGGLETVPDGLDRLFDKGEQSTFDDRIHLILLIVDKFEEFIRRDGGKFFFCNSEKLVSTLFKSYSIDFRESIQKSIDTTIHQSFLATSVYTEKFCEDFCNFCALLILDRVRDKLGMPEFEPSFARQKEAYFNRFPVCIWPLSRFRSTTN